MNRSDAKAEAVRLMDRVGIPAAKSGSTTIPTSSPAACGSG